MIAPIPVSPGLGRDDATYFPGTGMIYVIGGRSTNDPDTGSSTIYTYDPSSDTWGTASTTLTDTKTSNLAVAMLNGPSGPRIYAVGGAYGTGSVDLNPTNIVRVYDPVSGSLTQADNWPQVSPLALPGGWAVFNNKLYIFGGFDPVNTAMISDIWTFDPMAAAGSQWTHQSATLALARSYIATQTIGNFIYLAGGFDSTLTDQVTAERYDPATNTICDACMADLPAATSNAKGYTDGTLLYVPGGGFPSPVDTTRIYDPGTDTWNTLTAMAEPVRNYGAATIGTDFYAMGGIASDGATFLADAEKYSQGAGCATPTTPPASPTTPPATVTLPAASPTSPAASPTHTAGPAATATHTAGPAATATHTAGPAATATHTAGPSPTACTLQFTDVPPNSTFYPYIHCLACLGIVNGYPDGTFRPNANVTRGQLSKIVSNSAGFNDTPTGQQFQDVLGGLYLLRLHLPPGTLEATSTAIHAVERESRAYRLLTCPTSGRTIQCDQRTDLQDRVQCSRLLGHTDGAAVPGCTQWAQRILRLHLPPVDTQHHQRLSVRRSRRAVRTAREPALLQAEQQCHEGTDDQDRWTGLLPRLQHTCSTN